MKTPFTKVVPFSLMATHSWDRAALELLLQQTPYKEIQPNQLRSYGFIPAIDTENFVEMVGPGVAYIRFKVTERNLPKSVIKEKTDAVVDDIRLNESREVRRPEYLELWDKVVQELIPQAFPKHTIVAALLTPTHIFVDTGSAKRAEDVLSALRGCLGTLPVQVLTCTREVGESITDLMLGSETWDDFGLGERFKAKGANNSKSTLSGTHMDLGRKDLLSLIEGTRKLVELELTWKSDDDVHETWFVLTKDATLKSIVYPPEMSDSISEECGEDSEAETILRATLHMIADHLQKLVGQLCERMGGEFFGPAGERLPCQRSLAEALGNLIDDENLDTATKLVVMDMLVSMGEDDVPRKLLSAAARAFPPGARAIMRDPLQSTNPKKEFLLVDEDDQFPDGPDYSDVDDMI